MSRSRSNTSSTCDSFTQWDRAYPEETREYLARNAARCRPWAENVRPGAPSTSNSPTHSANAYRRRGFDPLQFLHHYQHNPSTISVHSSASQPSRSDRHERTESYDRFDRGSSRDDSQISPTHKLSPPIIPQYYTPRHAQVQSHSDPIPPRTANFSHVSMRRNAYTNSHSSRGSSSRSTSVYSSLSRAECTPPHEYGSAEQQQPYEQPRSDRYLSPCGGYYIEDRTPDMYRH